MDFNVNREVRKVFELLASNQSLRRLAWGFWFVAMVWVLPPLVAAIRWW